MGRLATKGLQKEGRLEAGASRTQGCALGMKTLLNKARGHCVLRAILSSSPQLLVQSLLFLGLWDSGQNCILGIMGLAGYRRM